MKPGDRIIVAIGMLSFSKDLVPLLESRVKQYYNVVRFRDMKRGSHFGIHEQASEYAKKLHEFFRPLRP